MRFPDDLAAQLLRAQITTGAARYHRQRHLPRLLHTSQWEDKPLGYGDHIALLDRLCGAIRRERNLGIQAHWAYRHNRHIGLMQAYRAEIELLKHKLKAPGQQGRSRPLAPDQPVSEYQISEPSIRSVRAAALSSDTKAS